MCRWATDPSSIGAMAHRHLAFSKETSGMGEWVFEYDGRSTKPLTLIINNASIAGVVGDVKANVKYT
jgi:hypothetical protein